MFVAPLISPSLSPPREAVMRIPGRPAARTFVLLFAACAVLSCDRVTAPEAPWIPDPATLQRATIVHVDFRGDGVVSSGASVPAGMASSLLGGDAIDAH